MLHSWAVSPSQPTAARGHASPRAAHDARALPPHQVTWESTISRAMYATASSSCDATTSLERRHFSRRATNPHSGAIVAPHRRPTTRADAVGSKHVYPEDYLDLGPRIRTQVLDDDAFDAAQFDFVCDARAPSEYDDDHVPGAVSTAVLNDAQRKEVGTLYKQVDPFEAKKVGAAMVAANLGKIIDERFLTAPRDTKILVYCWRGGERSLSLAHVLSRIGFDVYFAPGGYKRYRAGVLEFLRGMDKFRYHVIAGKTGCAKGKLLDALEAAGAQVIDLEVMANHRGSILGEEPGAREQPSQKMFDSRIAFKARTFDASRPVFVEGESSMIGKVQVPSTMWSGMRIADVTQLEIPMSERVKWIRAGYKHFETTETGRLLECIDVLVKRVGHERVSAWKTLVANGQWDEFVQDILVNHYDAAYAAAAARSRPQEEEKAQALFLDDTSDETYAKATKELLRRYDPSAEAR
jgi:tRNA 2-selenouridine synthase